MVAEKVSLNLKEYSNYEKFSLNWRKIFLAYA